MHASSRQVREAQRAELQSSQKVMEVSSKLSKLIEFFSQRTLSLLEALIVQSGLAAGSAANYADLYLKNRQNSRELQCY